MNSESFVKFTGLSKHTDFYCNPLYIRQTQKDVDSSLISYTDMKILAQVNEINNPTKIEIEETKRKDLNSNFVLDFLPDCSQETGKLLGKYFAR